jgi:hypothetical protein
MVIRARGMRIMQEHETMSLPWLRKSRFSVEKIAMTKIEDTTHALIRCLPDQAMIGSDGL